jgi:hypothetical protein
MNASGICRRSARPAHRAAIARGHRASRGPVREYSHVISWAVGGAGAVEILLVVGLPARSYKTDLGQPPVSFI